MISIKDYFKHEIIIEKSRFICYLKRIKTTEEAQLFINVIKKKHYNASHNCSAFVIGENQEIRRSSDNGEPSGTAGIPMLEVLLKNNMTNTCAVVTRYFGGIKLGAGGLIRAYSNSVSACLKLCELVEIKKMQNIKVTIDYNLLGTLENYFRNKSLIYKTNYTDIVEFDIMIDILKTQIFIEKITDLCNGKLTYNLGDVIFYDFPYYAK